MTPDQLFDLTGKSALVTGGATGVGRMAAEGLAAAGAKVFIASRKGEACEAAAQALNAQGHAGKVVGFAGDIGTEAGVTALAAEVAERSPALNILVNNAGRTWGEPLGQFPYSAWDKVMTVNVTGLFHLTQALLPNLTNAATDDDPARIVNVGSIMGDVPYGDGAYSYSASKAAVLHLTKILAKELTEKRITVNALAPGPFVSNMTAFATQDAEQRAKVGTGVPLGRVGRAEDIAGCLQFLCGRGGAYLTGAALPVSGGLQVITGEPLFDRAFE